MIQNLYINRFIVYPYFIDFPTKGEWVGTYLSISLYNIQDSYCDPDDTKVRLLVMRNKTSLTNMDLDGFWNRQTA